MRAYYLGFPSCCGATILYGFEAGYDASSPMPKGKDHLYLGILTEHQRAHYGAELEKEGYEVIKVFRTGHSSSYDLYLYASPRPDKFGKINNPGKSPPLPKAPKFFGRLVALYRRCKAML